MRVVFDAGRQRWKIWFVAAISLFTGAVLVWLGGFLFTRYGLDAADGGVLKPLWIRALFGVIAGGSGLGIIGGILLYLRCYVTRIEADDADGFRVSVAAPGAPLLIRPGDVDDAGFNDGVAHGGGISVNAPWYSLHLRGRRFPLIVDLQGDFLDESTVSRLIDGVPAPAAAPIPHRNPMHSTRRRP